jgi:hypothetical protein
MIYLLWYGCLVNWHKFSCAYHIKLITIPITKFLIAIAVIIKTTTKSGKKALPCIYHRPVWLIGTSLLALQNLVAFAVPNCKCLKLLSL